MAKKTITIGIPCFNEEDNVLRAYEDTEKIVKQIKSYRFDYLFVDNGSTDSTREKMKALIKRDKRVRAIFLSRNFGPESSGTAIMDFAKSEALVILHCDLQDPPDMIPIFLKKWESGFDIVSGQYAKTEDPEIVALARRLFYYLFKKISDIDIPIQVSGYGLYDKKVLAALKLLPEKYRFSRGLISWVGFKRAFVSYERRKRQAGKSSQNFITYLKQSERGIFGFSYLPLDLIAYFGFFLTFVSFAFIVLYLITVFLFGNPIKAPIPIMLAVVFFGGINLLAVSILGKYIQVMVEETKNRPVYLIEEKINFKGYGR